MNAAIPHCPMIRSWTSKSHVPPSFVRYVEEAYGRLNNSVLQVFTFAVNINALPYRGSIFLMEISR